MQIGKNIAASHMLKILDELVDESNQANAQQQQPPPQQQPPQQQQSLQLSEVTAPLHRILVRGIPSSKDKELVVRRAFSSVTGKTT